VTPDLLIIGASARGAVHSALRAGLLSCAVDLFADRDLVAVASVQRILVRDYPRAFPEYIAAFPGTPWLYTGSLENEPDLLDRIAATRPIWGIAGDAVRAVRDPFRLARFLDDTGFSRPEFEPSLTHLPRDGTWLVKPFASGGGRGIRIVDGDFVPSSVPSYYQRRIDGESLSATYVGTANSARLLGITCQFLGIAGQPFLYRGNVGPWPVSNAVSRRIRDLGCAIAAEFCLMGLFGVDFVLRDEEPWTIEVNPRYTSSVEVLEMAQQRSLLEEHVRAFLGEGTKIASLGAGAGAPSIEPPTQPRRFVAKAVLYAQHDHTLAIDLPVRIWSSDSVFSVPTLADIPAQGTRSSAGEPVVTVFSHARQLNECISRLERSIRLWSNRLGLSS
jgi:uncharacterized protein